MWGYDHGTWWGWLLMSVGMLAVWWLVIWGVVALVRGDFRGSVRQGPEDILRTRFAAGEIDEPEFRERLSAL